jgi:stage IV sporulation protein B
VKNRDTRQKLVLLALAVLVFTLAAFPWRIWINLQQDLRILEGEERFINIASPWTVHIKGSKDGIIALNGNPVSTEASKVNLRSPLALSAQGLGTVNVEFRLFGIIPLRQLTVNVLPEIKLLPGGHSVGIKLHSEGVLVVGHHLVNSSSISASPAKDAGIEMGDVILYIDGVRLDDANQVADIINRQGKAGRTLTFVLKRANRQLTTEVTPLLCRETGRHRIGLYIRDSAAGVGTMTFYDPKSGVYGALGHVITDVDTNQAIEVRGGKIVKANIVSIKTARRGQPGEKTGIFQEDQDIVGSIEKNCVFGIFGRLTNINTAPGSYTRPMPIALMSQVQTGPAEILTVVEGEKIEKFDIEIQRVYSQSSPSDKGMVIRIVDERLLEVAGGIVQGMSGSPIIQNNRLVGAVTHVFVNDPSRGYGIFVEWMIQESGLLDEISGLGTFKDELEIAS